MGVARSTCSGSRWIPLQSPHFKGVSPAASELFPRVCFRRSGFNPRAGSLRSRYNSPELRACRRDTAKARASEGTGLAGSGYRPARSPPAPPSARRAGSAAPLRAGPRRPGRGSAERRAPRELGPAQKFPPNSGPAPPPPTPAPGLGRPRRRQGQGRSQGRSQGRAGPAVSLWRARSSRRGRAEPEPEREREEEPGARAASRRPRRLGGSPSRRLPSRLPPPGGRLPGARGRCSEPRALRGAAERAPGLRARPCRASPGVGAAPTGPDTCSARPVGRPGQDESDRVLRPHRHRGALQGGPAARAGAHAAGAAEVPEDPRDGERGAGGARADEGARLPAGALPAGAPRPGRLPGARGTAWRRRGDAEPQAARCGATCGHNFRMLRIEVAGCLWEGTGLASRRGVGGTARQSLGVGSAQSGTRSKLPASEPAFERVCR